MDAGAVLDRRLSIDLVHRLVLTLPVLVSRGVGVVRPARAGICRGCRGAWVSCRHRPVAPPPRAGAAGGKGEKRRGASRHRMRSRRSKSRRREVAASVRSRNCPGLPGNRRDGPGASMTCQECQPLAIDLARSVPPFDVGGAVQRADVLSHVATCKRCAQWLREQEALSNALRSDRRSRRLSVRAAGRRGERDGRIPRTAAFAAAWMWSSGRPAWPAGRAAGFAAVAAPPSSSRRSTLAAVRWLNPPLASNGGTTNVANASTTSPSPLPSPLPPAAGRSAEGAGGQSGESAGARVTSTGTNAAVIEVLPDKGRKTTKGAPPAPPRATPATVRDGPTVARRRAHGTSGVNVGARERASSASRRSCCCRMSEPLRPTEMRHIMRVRMTRAQFAAGELRASGCRGCHGAGGRAGRRRRHRARRADRAIGSRNRHSQQ